MALTITQINPQETMRSVLLDPLAAQERGYIALDCFDAATRIDTGPKNGQPGLSAGTLRVRDPRNTTRAASGQNLRQAIGSPRVSSDRYPDLTVNFACWQATGFNQELIANIENGYTAEEERLLFEVCRSSHDLKVEANAAIFFTRIAADAATDGISAAGWRELDWTGAGYTALASNTTALENFQVVYNAAVAAARGKKPTDLFLPQETAQQWQRDPQVLGRIVAGAPAAGYAMVNGVATAPMSHVEKVFMEHFDFKRVLIGSGMRDTGLKGDAESPSYIWPNNRMWMGCRAPVAATVIGQQPRVTASGAYALVVNKLMATETGPDQVTAPQHQIFVAESFLDMVALKADEGTVVHSLN